MAVLMLLNSSAVEPRGKAMEAPLFIRTLI